MDKGRMKCLLQDSQAVSVHFPRIMIAAEKSGGGKTLFTCALLSLLKEKIQEVRAFKCGPDYIDPMFHRTVLEIPSRNLDSFFADGDTLRYLLDREVLEMEKFLKAESVYCRASWAFTMDLAVSRSAPVPGRWRTLRIRR